MVICTQAQSNRVGKTARATCTIIMGVYTLGVGKMIYIRDLVFLYQQTQADFRGHSPQDLEVGLAF
jgi:hypothetical protein